MRLRLLLCIVLFLAFAPFALADLITYSVTVNTSSIAGTAGSIDLNFDPGPLTTEAANAQVLKFVSDGALAGSPSITGDVSGMLVGTLIFDNGSGFNDYFQRFTYGSTLLFDVMLYGPALSAPNAAGTSGSTFAFSMFSDAAGTIPTLTTDLVNGFAARIDVGVNGTSIVTNFSPDTSVNAVPEPSTGVLIGTAIAIMGALFCLGRRGRA